MAVDIYKSKGVVTEIRTAQRLFFFIIFEIVFHNSNLQSTKHHKLSPAN